MCACVCMYIYICICIYIYIYMHIHIHIYAPIHTSGKPERTAIHIHVYTYIHAYMHNFPLITDTPVATFSPPPRKVQSLLQSLRW